jgi:hypothetical protein
MFLFSKNRSAQPPTSYCSHKRVTKRLDRVEGDGVSNSTMYIFSHKQQLNRAAMKKLLSEP